MESVRKNLPALEKSKDLAKPLPPADLSIDLALSDSEDDDEALLLEQLKEKENVPAVKQPSKTPDSDSEAENDLMEALANLKPKIQPKPQKQPKARNTLQPQNPPKPQDPPKAQNPPKPRKTSNDAAAPSTVATSKYLARKNEQKFYESMAAMAVPVVPVKPLPKPRRSEPASNPRFAEMEAKKERELVKRNNAIARKQAKEQAADAVAQKRKAADDCPTAQKAPKIDSTASHPSSSSSADEKPLAEPTKPKRIRDACGVCNKRGDKTCIVTCAYSDDCHRWAHWDCITADEFWRCKPCVNESKPKRPRKPKT